MNLTGIYVSYMLGVPSVKAMVIGTVGDDYMLHQEYDTFNEQGEWVHVTKQFQRNKWFIDSYYDDQFEAWCDSVRLSSQRDDRQGIA